jgi:hypothetical protein
MNFNDYDHKILDEFFASIEPMLAGYKRACFSYVAVKQGEAFELSQGFDSSSSLPLVK